MGVPETRCLLGVIVRIQSSRVTLVWDKLGLWSNECVPRAPRCFTLWWGKVQHVQRIATWWDSYFGKNDFCLNHGVWNPTLFLYVWQISSGCHLSSLEEALDCLGVRNTIINSWLKLNLAGVVAGSQHVQSGFMDVVHIDSPQMRSCPPLYRLWMYRMGTRGAYHQEPHLFSRGTFKSTMNRWCVVGHQHPNWQRGEGPGIQIEGLRSVIDSVLDSV